MPGRCQGILLASFSHIWTLLGISVGLDICSSGFLSDTTSQRCMKFLQLHLTELWEGNYLLPPVQGFQTFAGGYVRFKFPLDAVSMSFRDPSGVTFKVESILIVWVYLHQVHLLLHSSFINAWALSNATRLGVISEVCSQADGILAGSNCIFTCWNI